MQKRQRAADDRIPRAGQPAGLLRRQRLHVAADGLDEERLRHLREQDRLSRSRRSGLRNQMTNRALQPLAGRIAAKVDLDHQRQAGKEKPVGMTLAAEIAADKSGHLAAAAQSHRGQIARQVFGRARLRCR